MFYGGFIRYEWWDEKLEFHNKMNKVSISLYQFPFALFPVLDLVFNCISVFFPLISSKTQNIPHFLPFSVPTTLSASFLNPYPADWIPSSSGMISPSWDSHLTSLLQASFISNKTAQKPTFYLFPKHLTFSAFLHVPSGTSTYFTSKNFPFIGGQQSHVVVYGTGQFPLFQTVL